MARILQVNTNSISGIKITNHLEDGTLENNEIYEGDSVTDLKYVEGSEVKKVTGRVDDIASYYSDKATARVGHIKVDHSTENHADITYIHAVDLIEYNTENAVKKVTTEPVFKVNLKVTLSDDSSTEITLTKGMTVEGLVFTNDSISADDEIEGNFVVRDWIFSTDVSKEVSVIGIKISDVEDETKVAYIGFRQIKNCGTAKEDDGTIDTTPEKDPEKENTNETDEITEDPVTPQQ